MDGQQEKCVMVIDRRLPLGLAANTAAILGITLGKQRPDTVGEDVADAGGREHPGIIRFPVPILRGTPEVIREIRQRLYQPEFSGLTVVDFSGLAQGCGAYQEFTAKMAATPEEDLQYYGIAICGDKRRVNRLTGSLPLLR